MGGEAKIVSRLSPRSITSYEIFKNNKFRADKETYQGAINYFVKLLKSFDSKILPSDAKLQATALVNRLLAIGRTEGSTPAARLKAIANASMELNIPKTTFNKFTFVFFDNFMLLRFDCYFCQ